MPGDFLEKPAKIAGIVVTEFSGQLFYRGFPERELFTREFHFFKTFIIIKHLNQIILKLHYS